MANDFSPLDVLTEPDAARTREMQAARRRTLQARLPGAMALALGPAAGGQAVGRELLSEEGPQEQQAAQLAEARLLAQHRGVQEKQGWAQLAQGRWVPIVKSDPMTGETITLMLDSRTGKVHSLVPRSPQLAPSHAPGGLPPMPIGLKMSEGQQKIAGAEGGAVAAMRNALQVGFPKTGLLGLPQAVGQKAMQYGFPGLASPEAQQTYSAWYNVIRPLVNIRTGQQMSNQELTRELNALAPWASEDPRTQLMKVHNLIPMLRPYIYDLPRPLAQRLDAEYSQVERMLPRTVEELRAMQASGTPGQYRGQEEQQTQPGPVGSVNGRPVGYR